ncbi:MAG: hypothetical protein HY650_02420 [Acidobacteria bacterium]|nr:hypothetical protein [Acidobacteriota bacterium]
MRQPKLKRRKVLAPVPVRFAEEEESLYKVIRARASAESRSVSAQIKYYARLGLMAKDNPDLPMSFIEGIVEGLEESRAGLAVPYEFGVLK